MATQPITSADLPADTNNFFGAMVCAGFKDELARQVRLASQNATRATALIALLAAADTLLDAEIA